MLLLSVTTGRIYVHNTTMRPNDTDTNDNVYSAIIMVRPLREFTWFTCWMQTECQMATNSQTKLTDFACESAGKLLPSTSTSAIYKAQKLILILLSHGG